VRHTARKRRAARIQRRRWVEGSAFVSAEFMMNVSRSGLGDVMRLSACSASRAAMAAAKRKGRVLVFPTLQYDEAHSLLTMHWKVSARAITAPKPGWKRGTA
jgi:protein-disulfide isomerase-like protein with CxxC motif